MNSYLKKVLRENNAVSIIKTESIESFIKVKLISFLTLEGKYGTVLVVYNETSLLGKATKLIGDGNSDYDLLDILRTNVTIFDTRDDYLENKIVLPSKENLDSLFSSVGSQICEFIMSTSTINFKVSKAILYTNPVSMIIVYFSFKGLEQKPLKLFIGQKNICEDLYIESSEEFKKFVRTITEFTGGVVFI